jgi:hypothetical protein
MRLWKSLQEASKRLLPDCVIAASGCRACPELAGLRRPLFTCPGCRFVSSHKARAPNTDDASRE